MAASDLLIAGANLTVRIVLINKLKLTLLFTNMI